MFCENCGKEIKDENKFCPYCGASVQPEQNGEQPEQSAQPEQKSEQPEQSAQPEQKNEQPKQSAQPEQKSEQPKQSAQSDQRLTQKETTGNSSADVKNKGVSHPAPKKKKTAVVIGIIAMAAVIIIGIIAAVKMFGSSDAKETAKDSTYKEVKENAAEKESKPAKKENVKPKKETDGEMKKDSGQEEKKEEKDNSKREAVLTDPVTMGWAGTYKDDDSGDRLVIASIGYEWSYVIYTSSGQIFEKESECGAFGDYLEVLCIFVQSRSVCLKKGSHLVNKRTCAPCTDSVHTLFYISTFKIDDFRILTSELNRHISLRCIVLQSC